MASLDHQVVAQEERQHDKGSGGFVCEFVDPPPEHLLQTECPVCLLIIREPHQVTCCGYIFCYSCIQRIKERNKRCPTCKMEVFSNFLDKRLERTLSALKVYCSHKEDGCKWTGELGQLDAHLNEDPELGKQLDGCRFVEINCLYECGDNMQREYMPSHQTEHCTKRPFSCEHCHNYESNYDDVIHNHWPVCGSFPLHCPNQCGSFPQRQDIDRHINNECPLTNTNCDFHQVGCMVKLPRKDIPEHLRENLIAHVSLQQTQIAVLVTENERLKSRNTNLEQNLLSLETNLTLLQAKVAVLMNEKVSLRSIKSGEQDSTQSHPQTEAQTVQLSSTTPPATPVSHITIPLGPPILTMTSFKLHKRHNNWWLSPPVYTHHQGYKFLLRVAPNGDGSGRGTHVSVYVSFMRGEFDDFLKWPFCGVISIRLLDQIQGERHATRTVPYNDSQDDRVSGRVTKGEKGNKGRGHAKFIAHSELEPTYLQNDTLMFQIHQVELS